MFDYEFKNTDIDDVTLIEVSSFKDVRGELYSIITPELELELNIGRFGHHKIATNTKNVLRGIHGDHKSWKMVSCLKGKIQQVVVDNRIHSRTYKKYITFDFNDESKFLLLIPPGVGNGFKTLSDESIYYYALSYNGQYSDFDEQFTLKYDDSEIGIEWQGGTPILSKRDS